MAERMTTLTPVVDTSDPTSASASISASVSASVSTVDASNVASDPGCFTCASIEDRLYLAVKSVHPHGDTACRVTGMLIDLVPAENFPILLTDAAFLASNMADAVSFLQAVPHEPQADVAKQPPRPQFTPSRKSYRQPPSSVSTDSPVDKFIGDVLPQPVPKTSTRPAGSRGSNRRPAKQPVTGASEFHRLGNRHFEHQEYTKAIQCYTTAIGLGGNKLILQINRAAALGRLQQLDLASVDCNAVLARNPNDLRALACKASLELRRGNATCAMQLCHTLEAVVALQQKNDATTVACAESALSEAHRIRAGVEVLSQVHRAASHLCRLTRTIEDMQIFVSASGYTLVEPPKMHQLEVLDSKAHAACAVQVGRALAIAPHSLSLWALHLRVLDGLRSCGVSALSVDCAPRPQQLPPVIGKEKEAPQVDSPKGRSKSSDFHEAAGNSPRRATHKKRTERLSSPSKPQAVEAASRSPKSFIGHPGYYRLANSASSDGAAAENLGTAFTGFSSPTAVAVARDASFALVANSGKGNIARLDIRNGHVSFYPYIAEAAPIGVALARDNSFAVVIHRNSNAVARLDIITGEVTFPFSTSLFLKPAGIALSSDDSFALVTDFDSNSVGRICLKTGKVKWPGFAGITAPTGVAISFDNSYALVTSLRSSTVRRIDLSTGEIGIAPAGARPGNFHRPTGIALSRDDSCYFVSNTGHDVRRVDCHTQELDSAVFVQSPAGIALDVNSRFLLVAGGLLICHADTYLPRFARVAQVKAPSLLDL
eukprot:INCI3677.2.p1 GENE.INCI3677.2~~INCI3677.2.p1  ORF type:complete len:770 (+),score=82.12 INCI3677.2:249-2558(+)